MAYSGDEPGEQWLLRSEPAEAAAVDGLSVVDNRPQRQLQLNTIEPLLLVVDALPVNINTNLHIRCAMHTSVYLSSYLLHT